MLNAVSLFSNCGAGDVGYREAGFAFRVLAELEIKRLKVAALNHPEATVVWDDVRETLNTVIAAWRTFSPDEAPDLLCACPPCQGMSSARAFRRGEKRQEVNDRRNLLIEVVAEAVRQLKPRAIVVENVPQFLTRPVIEVDGTPTSAPAYLMQQIGADYEAFPVVFDLAHFGVPQRRRRTFVTLLRRDEKAVSKLRATGALPYPQPTAGATSLSAALSAAGLDCIAPSTRVQANADGWIQQLHVVPDWPKDDWRRRLVAATKTDGGSAWNNVTCSGDCGDVEVGADAVTCPECAKPLLRPVVIKGDEVRFVKGFRNTSYRRHDSRTVAATITTASGHVGSDTTLHPTEPRLLSVAECGVLQTFPATFDWGEAPTAWGLGKVREMIGEAVPPHFTAQHGKVLAALLQGETLPPLLSADDERHVRHQAKLSPPLRLPLGAQAAVEPQPR